MIFPPVLIAPKGSRILPGLMLVMLLGGCETKVPFLRLGAKESYQLSSGGFIAYSFSSENSVQSGKCLLEYRDVSGSGGPVYVEEYEFVRELPSEGAIALSFSKAGSYRFTLTLLSDRGSLRDELEFLQESVEFEVVE